MSQCVWVCVCVCVVLNWVMRTTGGAKDKHAPSSRCLAGWDGGRSEEGSQPACVLISAPSIWWCFWFNPPTKAESHKLKSGSRKKKKKKKKQDGGASSRTRISPKAFCQQQQQKRRVSNWAPIPRYTFPSTRGDLGHQLFFSPPTRTPADQSAAALLAERMQDHGGERQVASRWVSNT